ncbi:MAG TPA: hypothetical protein DHV59_11505 [Oxalobacteraceae bacterium]|nr:hypothetical protein [Oxalobacteraceae bacterium]
MDTLAKLFPVADSAGLLQTFISIALAAVVFFYFVSLLRKEEMLEQEDEAKISADIGTEVQGRA